MKEEIIGYTNSLKEWISESIDKRVGEVFDAMNLATNEHLKALSAKVDTLAKKVEQMEKAQAKVKKKPAKKTSTPRKKTAKPSK